MAGVGGAILAVALLVLVVLRAGRGGERGARDGGQVNKEQPAPTIRRHNRRQGNMFEFVTESE